jgi:hypothetical protein
MRWASTALAIVTAASGCSAASSELAAAASGDLPYEAAAPVASALPARTWRLSHAQYAEAVRSFLGAMPDMTLFEEELDNGLFSNMSGSGFVRAPLARDYYDAAALVSSELTPDAIAHLIGGRALSSEQKLPFLRAALRGAFRRPASAEELAEYGEIFELGAEGAADETGPFRAVIRALLTSPFFLYRTEIGVSPESKSFSLTDHELASLLSFSLLGGPPPEYLLVAAESGELSNPARLEQYIRALLAQPEAANQLRTFMTQWLELQHFDRLERDALLYPDFAAQRPLLWAEAEDMLAEHAALTGTLRGLLTAPLAPSPELAAYYGSDPSAAGAIGERVGVLSLGAVVAAHSRPYLSSPTLRGLFVRDRLLCQQIHLPPGGVPNIFEALLRTGARTTRDLYEQHAENPSCAGCHSLLDSIGFNFEDLDAAGRFRSLENDVPIDTSGELVNADVSGPTRNRGELTARLSESAWVRECFARQAFRFYFGAIEADRGVPAIQAAQSALERGTFGELLIALLTSESALQRVRP